MKSSREKTESPLSLRRITEAFAQMLGRPASVLKAEGAPIGVSSSDPCPVSPRSIVEAILFVGRPDGTTFTAEELTRTMRDVTQEEVATAVSELNQVYAADGAPYRIASTAMGYRLELREEFHRLGYRLQGRVREAKLSPQALEVLAVVAYRQPVTAVEIENLRGGKSGAVLAQLVRRGLLRFDHTGENSRERHYSTTDRFLRLFSLASLSQLPDAEEFDLSMP